MASPEALARSVRRVGSFELQREIGEGGMGVVYLARQPALERLVVLKKIRRELVSDEKVVERFQREARAAASVHHQNVVAVHDCFEARGDHYIALEYVDGIDLREILGRAGRLEPQVVALIALEVARGLEEIHAQGVVHRDLKPANILVGRRGEVKIADFGIALESRADGLTHPGMVMGSVPYMSPEQMMGERVDHRSDFFLFGILLYEMLSGGPPFRASKEDDTDTLLERMQRGSYDSLRKQGVRAPWYLSRLVRACLRPKAGERLPTATDLRRRLERRVGRVSPADCRRRIADHLAAQGVYAGDGESTAPRAAEAPECAGFWRGLPPAARIGSVAGLVVAGVVVTVASWPSPERAGPPPTVPASLPETSSASTAPTAGPAMAAVTLPPAVVRFSAYPWAEIRVDGEPPFLTPRAAPVALAPGRHEVIFSHPRYGQAREVLEVSPGEERAVRHVFAEAPAP